MINLIEKYIKDLYGDSIKINDFADKNLCFDIYLNDRNINISYEYKERYFKTGKDDRYLFEYDLLVELVQGCFEFKKILNNNITNQTINKITNSKRINTIMGWFYKCLADRLLYVKYLNDELFDTIDIDFRLFKDWFNNYIDDSKTVLQWCKLTTGTINAIVPYKDIPKSMFYYNKKIKSS